MLTSKFLHVECQFCKSTSAELKKIHYVQKMHVGLYPLLDANRGVQIGPFCKQFNDATKHIKPGIPLPTTITANPDRTVGIQFNKPPVSYFLKMAAGTPKGSWNTNSVCGKVSLKHVYEIAKIKSEDPAMEGLTLEQVCNHIIGTARSCGIEVVRELDPVQYAQFLEQRKEDVKKREQELEDLRQAKLLRL